jgi:Extensin-like protein C-terminus
MMGVRAIGIGLVNSAAVRRLGFVGRAALLVVGASAFFLPATLSARPAKQKAKKPRVVFDADWASTPAAKYAALDKDACLEEATSRGIAYEEVSEARGVTIPVRLTGPLNGVSYHTELPEKDRATSPYEVFDCRLVLALYDFSAILTAHDVNEALIFSAWRPPGDSWPEGKQATRHSGALAVDIRVFEVNRSSSSSLKDLVVARDWAPARDKAPCGDKAPPVAPDTAAAKEIHAIYCKAADDRIFSSMLGPNYNKAHENHFHLEITPDVKWRLTL